MNKTLFKVLIFIGLPVLSLAQQDRLVTHFMYDKMGVNPGKTGMDGGICGTMIYRSQWDKAHGAPNTFVFNAEADMSRFFPGGLGISFYHDDIGFNRQNNVLLNYSYPIDLGGYGTLGVGIGIGLMNFSMDPNWVPPTTSNDNTLPVGFSDNNVDMNFGIYFKGTEDYYVGLSSTHLSQSAFEDGVNATFNSSRHYYLMGGKTFRDIGPGYVQADLITRTDLVKTSFEVSGRYFYEDIAYGGVSFRTSDAVSVLLGYMPVQNMTIGYSYDITINKLAGISKGSHEIMLKYCYFLPPPPIQKSKHPRWL